MYRLLCFLKGKKRNQLSQNIKAGRDSFLQGYVPQLNNGIARSIKWLDSQCAASMLSSYILADKIGVGLLYA